MSRGSTPGRYGERGIALAAVVFVLVVLEALLAGLWFAGLQEYRIGGNVADDRRAFDAAESGLDAELAAWDAGTLDRLGVGDSASFSGAVGGGAWRYVGAVRRLGARLFLVRSTGIDARSSFRRTVAVVARLAPQRLGAPAALVASGPVRLGGGALVDALAPDSGGCAGASREAAGIVVGSAGGLDLSGCAAETCLRGSPGWSVDAALRSGTVPLLGDDGWASLAAAAETLGTMGALPSGPRVWLSPGDLSLPAGDLPGPAVLLVQGDLVIESGARFTGLIVVRGSLIMRGVGGTIVGTAIVGGADLAALAGAKANLVYSTCAVDQALLLAAPARPLGERAWMVEYHDAL
jgi:hypothetical protein